MNDHTELVDVGESAPSFHALVLQSIERAEAARKS